MRDITVSEYEGTPGGGRDTYAGIAAPPMTHITLEQAPAALNPARAVRADGKTVITL